MFWVFVGLGCNTPQDQYTSTEQTDTTPNQGLQPADGALYSAYFGLDNKLPEATELLCPGGGGKDGMPVVFSKELDVSTVQAGDFKVRKASGKSGSVACATFVPAVDDGEMRTVLLIGEFGNATDDPPATVRLVGNIHDIEQRTNFKGQSVAITPLAAGPFLVRAEVAKLSRATGTKPNNGPFGTRCPDTTVSAVRAIWSGGVTKPGGDPATLDEGKLYRVTLRSPDGSLTQVAPFFLADTQDGDNNHLLCLDQQGIPTTVSFPAGHLTDPNEDARNPDTTVVVIAQ